MYENVGIIFLRMDLLFVTVLVLVNVCNLTRLAPWFFLFLVGRVFHVKIPIDFDHFFGGRGWFNS